MFDKPEWEEILATALVEAMESVAPPPQPGMHSSEIKLIDYLLEVVNNAGADSMEPAEPALPALTRQDAFNLSEGDALFSASEITTPPPTPPTPTTPTKKRCCIKKRKHPICARVMNKEFYCTKRLGHLGLCAA